jgi:hypothetical protein
MNSAEKIRLCESPCYPLPDATGDEVSRWSTDLRVQYFDDLATYAAARFRCHRVTVILEGECEGEPFTKELTLEGSIVYTTHSFGIIATGLHGVMLSAIAEEK